MSAYIFCLGGNNLAAMQYKKHKLFSQSILNNAFLFNLVGNLIDLQPPFISPYFPMCKSM